MLIVRRPLPVATAWRLIQAYQARRPIRLRHPAGRWAITHLALDARQYTIPTRGQIRWPRVAVGAGRETVYLASGSSDGPSLR